MKKLILSNFCLDFFVGAAKTSMLTKWSDCDEQENYNHIKINQFKQHFTSDLKENNVLE